MGEPPGLKTMKHSEIYVTTVSLTPRAGKLLISTPSKAKLMVFRIVFNI